MQFSTGAETIKVNVPGPDELLARVGDHLASGRGFAVATLNLDHIVKLAALPDFRRAYASHELIVADGRPVVWLNHLSGNKVQLAPGSEMILPMCRLAARLDVPVALVGSTEAVLAKSASALEDSVPGLRICARIAPTHRFDPDGTEADAIFGDLAEAGAQLVFLALGAPKQERLAARGRILQPSFGFVSIGAGLDFIAGQQRRAPFWMRRLALEWVWRMVRSPVRLGPRYFACLRILPKLMMEALRRRRKRSASLR